jgi:hypothetical protein
MGAMTFLLPSAIPPGLADDLGRACVAGGPDNMPWPTEVRVEDGKLTVRRDVDESGTLVVPWEVPRAGRVMSTTATLIEQPEPYQFGIELARGKVHQVRCQAADWQSGGLDLPDSLADQIKSASVHFGRAVTDAPAEGNLRAQEVLNLGYQAAEALVHLYIAQMFEARHQRQPRLDTTLGCCLGTGALTKPRAEALIKTCNFVSLPFTWGQVEPAESTYHWEPFDALLQWADSQRLAVTAGPLIDFSAARLPDWLWLWERDLSSLASFMCDYVETTVKRYAKRIRIWQLCTASNCSSVLGLGEDELLWLTAKIIEAARQVDPKLEISVGIAQPWGEYMAVEDRTHSPFIFADTLVRSGLNLAAIDLEMVMGITPRGSYCRDLLETSRFLDLYSLLGVPLRLTLGYPSDAGNDQQADPELKVAAGHGRGGTSVGAQADWASSYASLCVCKPSVRSVQWTHLADADRHQFPHCGLFSAQGSLKPAVQRLRELREKHLH